MSVNYSTVPEVMTDEVVSAFKDMKRGNALERGHTSINGGFERDRKGDL